jgi:predicted Zn-dependent peptidase
MNYEFYTLDNGVRVILVPMPGVESVAVGVFTQTGSRYETAKNNGISHFLEHMVFKGTKNYPSHEETSRLEGLGAIQNAWTDTDATAYWCKIPAEHWEKALDLIKDLALYPLIPEKDLEIERGVILEEINRKEDRPDELVGEESMKLMFPGHPLGMTILGETDVIKGLKREDFLEYHAGRYKAGRLIVAMAGKMDQISKIKEKVKIILGVVPKEGGESPVKFVDGQGKPEIAVKLKELAAQAHIGLSVRGIRSNDPDRWALDILTSYLGEGLSSRLFVELREKRGLCYAVSAGGSKWEDTGTWGVYAGLNIEKLEAAVGAIWEEMKRMREYKLTQEELSQAKEKVRGPFIFAMENPYRQMEFFARQVMDLPEKILSVEETVKRVMEIDAEQIQKVAQRLFLNQKLNLAVVGPVDQSRKEKLLDIMAS